uniref:peptidylprolyl isomerase n=1 Tax=Sphenodon punctatus TaxID=8508 RepID=A0A8D0HIE5_SPHPU
NPKITRRSCYDYMGTSGGVGIVGARLASLFGLDHRVSGQGNEFFQYTAPKQPKKGQAAAAQKPSTPAPASGAPSVFIATAVHAYRYINGQYVKQGKYGAAVVGNHATKEVQLNSYSTFYDDQRQNWSIMFESEKAAIDFSKQLCIAKCNSSPLDSVLYQDLILGEGQGVEVGDSLEVAYTGWLFQNNGLGQMFDSNVNKDKLLRLKLGSGKIIKGWEEGMMEMKKGGRRLLIIPPAFAYGSQGVANRVPPDSALAFEVEVKRVKLAKDSCSDGQSLSSRGSPAPVPGFHPDSLSADTVGMPPSALPPKPGEPAVRAKSNSISEQLANPDVAKAKLISRMAKMGQPMLPFLAGTTTTQLDSSDSEIEVCHQGFILTKVQVLIKVPREGNVLLLTISNSNSPYTGMAYAYPQAASTSQIQPVGQMYPAPFQASGDVTSFLMTEARQHNTEIRIAVSKVTDKIDHLAAKVEELQKQNTGNSLLPGISSVTMETAMIMNNIQRIIQENERLKQETFEKSSRIEEQNEKISELIERNQRYVEQSNVLMEQMNNSLQTTNEHTQARVLHVEQEKAKVAEELAAATAQISHLQLELTAHQKNEMDLRTRLTTTLQEAERHGTQINKLQAQLAELQETSENTRAKFKTEKHNRRHLDLKVVALEEELSDLRVEKENLEKNLAERKKKSLLERGQAEEEMDEIHKSYQEELDKLRQLLKKARTSTDQASAEQVSLVQAELESQWEAKCERMLASAKEQHLREYQEACEQRETQQQRAAQLEEKYSALQAHMVALKAHYEERIQELGKDSVPVEQERSLVKKIMNGVFQSLRNEFELDESYSGRTVLGVVMNTIKVHLASLKAVHIKGSENSRRLAEPQGSGPSRMVPQQESLPDDCQEVQDANPGPLCNKRELSGGVVHNRRKGTKRSPSGCSKSGMAKGSPLCIPSLPIVYPHNNKNQEREIPDNPRGSMVAEMSIVLSSDGAGNSGSVPPAIDTGSPLSRSSAPREPQRVKSNSLEVECLALQNMRYTNPVLKTLLQARRPATRRSYAAT